MPRTKKSDPRPSWDEFAHQLGRNLHALREQRGLSKERVAHEAGIASYTYQKFEKGESRPGTPMNPRLDTLIALCEVLGVALTDLLPSPLPPKESRPGSR